MMKLFFKTFIVLLLAGSGQLANAQQWDGLTLYYTQNSNKGYLMDTNGVTVKTWTFTGNNGYSNHMVPGGNLFRSVQNSGNALIGGGMTGRIQKVDYNGVTLWDYVYSSSTYCLHHDHCPLPNGNVLVISYDVKTATEVSAAGGTLTNTMWSEKIMELKPVGTNSAVVVWEWKAWDHLVQNVDPNKANYQPSIDGNPQLLNVNYKSAKDWMHMNGIDYNPVLDQIVLSSHNLNEWYVIDHSTSTAVAAGHSGGFSGKGGDILYRWGNPAAYGTSGTKILNVTHDAHWIPENCTNGGNLAGINNMGQTTPSNKTTADQIIVPRSNYNYTVSLGSAYSPASFSARKIGTGYTTNMGSVQEFPNGNQLICLATLGTIYEIDAAGNTLWTKNAGGFTPQSERRSLCYINNPAPVQPSITAIGDTLSTAATASYQWYCNGNLIPGATSQTVAAVQTGTYVVKTTDINGCVFVYSASFSHTVTTPPIDTGLNEGAELSSLTVFPNPSNGELHITFSNTAPREYSVSLYDITGKQVNTWQNQPLLDLSQLNNGLYILNITSAGGHSLNKKITLIK
ncbi:MAG: aryl-sulfate sulfotransferase [Bacteroidota bacterium]